MQDTELLQPSLRKLTVPAIHARALGWGLICGIALMYVLTAPEYPANRPELKGTLWHCAYCDSFITIHCAKVVYQALCPICMDGALEMCGTSSVAAERGLADA